MDKWVLFDLDGTLLPMDMDVFIKAYFGGLAKKLAPYGYNPEELVKAIWSGTGDMVKNDGSDTNEAVFWKRFFAIYGEKSREHFPLFDEFYKNDFDKIQPHCGFNPNSKRLVELLKKNGYRVGLATNPIFPAIATECRIRWAGLTPDDFEFYTTYENSRFCKPNIEYYRDILAKNGIDAKSCVMVGNDVAEDMIAEKLGMRVFLLTDCIINKNNDDISCFPHGGFPELYKFFGL